ncbi:MAG TPA: metal-dependent transcriptional regulator [bacterium]|nr:metal-dependent transcriptional regulator [bacterium]
MIVSGEGAFLTKKGEEKARQLVRRHRLWEVFFHDVLGLKEFNDMANSIEHEATGNVEESLCDFLGHPQQCPDGKPIPRGSCCGKRFRKKTGWGLFQQMGIVRLCDVEKGTAVRVVYIKESFFPKFSSFGIIPGSIIYVKETFPGFIIRIDHTEIALDKKLCCEILVHPVSEQKNN